MLFFGLLSECNTACGVLTQVDNGSIRLRDAWITDAVASDLWTANSHRYQAVYFYRKPLQGAASSESVAIGTGYDPSAVATLESAHDALVPNYRAFNSLLPIERAAVQLYTSNSPISWESNGQLWSTSSAVGKEWFVVPLASALGKLPKFSRTVYSGVSIKHGTPQDYIKEFFEGSSYVNKGFLSTSADNHSSYVKNRAVVLVVHGFSGVLVSPFSNYAFEQEILFPPGCNFKLNSVAKTNLEGFGEKLVIDITEI